LKTCVSPDTEEEKQDFRDHPEKLKDLRNKLIHTQNTFYEAVSASRL
jgi:hypothetical protein